MSKYHQQFLDYITNTGGHPTIGMFDEDWEPVGPMVRKDLIKMELIKEENGVITLREDRS